MKDHIIDDKDQYKAIGLCGFDYKKMRKRRMGLLERD